MIKDLTKADIQALNKIPENKWVEDVDMIRSFPRPYYRMKRLEDAGMLESRIVGKMPALTKQWIKLQNLNKKP